MNNFLNYFTTEKLQASAQVLRHIEIKDFCLIKGGQKIYRNSRIKEVEISKEHGMKRLRKRFVNGEYKGQYNIAIIFDNETKEILQKFDEYGKRILIN